MVSKPIKIVIMICIIKTRRGSSGFAVFIPLVTPTITPEISISAEGWLRLAWSSSH
ncbi:hypothetical protein GQ55_9G269500 [Panicum hallii var. hallii]|uniref:Uncharacterized protein n=1 Tax=Panicum hallii var. hallii TaxID=1504633 RepID=A0A2T7C7A6_9POAL|nr:hypothetical protein GQ55_9G269500 [Panicum hallii var. hallii]